MATTSLQQREIRQEKGVDLLGTVSSSEIKSKLEKIKSKMEKIGPSCGNFHLWYYEVYKLRQNGRMDLYNQSIDQKYEGLGLNVTE